MKPVAIYIRYSSHNQDGNLTTEIQERRCRDFLDSSPELAGRSAVVFTDAAMSGASFDRPDFQRMAEGVRAREYSAVLVYKYDRLGRDGLESERFVREFNWAGAPVYSATEPAHDLSRWVLAGVAEEFRRQLGQRCQDALRQNAEAGYWNGSAPYGYQLKRVRVNDGKRGERTTLQIDSGEAEIVRRVFKAAAAGESLRDIALALNAEGIPGPRGGAWATGGVRAIIVNTIYVGRRIALRWTRRRGPDGRRIQRQRPPSEWKEQDHPEWRIVSPGTWAEVSQRFADRRLARASGDAGRIARTRAGKYLLTGLIKCGTCGGPMTINKQGGRKRPYYYLNCSLHRRQGPTVCPNDKGYPLESAEETILRAVESRILSPKARRELLSIVERKAGERRASPSRRDTKRRVAKIEAEVRRLVDAVAAGSGQSSALTQALAERENELAKLKAQTEAPRRHARKAARILAEARRAVTDLANVFRAVIERKLTPRSSFRAALAEILTEAVLRTDAKGKKWLDYKIAPLAVAGLSYAQSGDPNGI